MMKWKKCFECCINGDCSNQDNEVPCGKILEDMYTKNNQGIEYLRDKVKLAGALFVLICLSKKRPEQIDEEKIMDLALELFGLYNKDCVDNERSSN